MFRVIYFLKVLQPEQQEATPTVLESGETAVEGVCIDVDLPQDRKDIRRRRKMEEEAPLPYEGTPSLAPNEVLATQKDDRANKKNVWFIIVPFTFLV